MREQFPAPPSRGDFNEKVWEIVRQIPQGQVMTYGQIAGMIPTPEGMDEAEYKAFRARWVGSAMAACPADVPWQRVINAQGKVSPRGPGAQHQRTLLEGEGVAFDDHGRIDLARFGWAGPSAQWLAEHGFTGSAPDFQERLL
jgi:methylated-DNA-protein-cysteine methyltransferase-like protein